jgi:phage-related protein
MAFYATSFIFDDIPSEEYGLIISSAGGEMSSNISNSVSIRTEKLFRNPVPYFYGVEQDSVLEMDVELRTTETELTSEDMALIQKWLFGKQSYKKLRIVQPDMEGYYYNCIFQSGEIIKAGNLIRGLNAHIICDSPFAWGETVTHILSEAGIFDIYNPSENNYYTLPQIVVVMEAGGEDWFNIVNMTENYRTFGMFDMSVGANETITIDNQIQTIQAVNTPSPLIRIQTGSLYDYFFRLLPGYNQIQTVGNISSCTISYSPMKRLV